MKNIFEIFKNILNKISLINSLVNNNNNFNYNNQNTLFDISENEKMKYKSLFDNKKEANMERISARNAVIIWKENNIDDQSIKDLSKIIIPLENKGFFNLKEFQVASYLINLSKKIKFPTELPLSLVYFLGRINNADIANIINDELEKIKNFLQNKNQKENDFTQKIKSLKSKLDGAQEEIQEIVETLFKRKRSQSSKFK